MSVRQGDRPLILFDGVCNLCNGAVRWIIERDRAHDQPGTTGQFHFASLQSKVARDAIAAVGGPRELPDSILVIMDGQVLAQSDAAIAIGRRLRFPWSTLAAIGGVLPRRLRDWVYALVARHRYQWFGRRDSCMVPSAALRSRFLDAGEWEGEGDALASHRDS